MTKRSIQRVGVIILSLVVLGQGTGAQSNDTGRTLSGATRDARGMPLEGVAVSARAVDRTYTTTVFTDEEGNYFFPPLAGGNYRLWAQATGYVTALAEAASMPRRPRVRCLR